MKRVQKLLTMSSAALAVALVLVFAQGAFATTASSRLETKVENAIGVYYPGDFTIQATPDGLVTIKGQTNTLYDKYRVFDLVSRVKGVRMIKDELAVDTPELPNHVVQENIRQELNLANSILEPERIKVSVDNGEVVLSGNVSSPNEKVVAETVASWQNGVEGITNNITVLPPQQATSDQNLRTVFSDILQNRFPLEKNVQFQVHAGVVTVSGQVSMLWSKEHIAKDFANVPGVKQVNNNLTVKPMASIG